MSSESDTDHIDAKRIKLEEKPEKLSSFDESCKNLVVDCYKNKCIQFFTKNLDDKSVRDYNTGKIF